MKKPIDAKFSIEVKSVVRPDSAPGSIDLETTVEIVYPAGVPIPDDEPLFLLRARDHHAVQAIEFYRAICRMEEGATRYHLDGIDERLAAFRQFRSDHPERMKQPGITEDR